MGQGVLRGPDDVFEVLMSVRNWLAGVAAAATVTAGITVVQSGITGTEWPGSGPQSATDAPSTVGLPAPGEVGGTLRPVGPIRPAAEAGSRSLRHPAVNQTGEAPKVGHKPAKAEREQAGPAKSGSGKHGPKAKQGKGGGRG